METVFDFSDYRRYLIHRLGAIGTRTGLRQKACELMGCHNTYLSQVLAEKIHLSLEHANALNSFFDHTEDESDFFLTLVLHGRAGTKSLKQRFEKQMKTALRKRTSIKQRIKDATELSDIDRDRFYSNWIYGAIHVLVSIESLQTPDQIARALGLHLSVVSQELEFMRQTGLVKLENGRFVIGPRSVHLGSDSPAITKHHSNWRYHTIQSLHRASHDDLHFSAAVTLNEDAVNEVREALLKNLERNLATIKKAKEEVGYVLAFDFYRFA